MQPRLGLSAAARDEARAGPWATAIRSKLLFHLGMQKVVDWRSKPTSGLYPGQDKKSQSRNSRREVEVNENIRAEMFVRLADEVGNAIRINNSNFMTLVTTPSSSSCVLLQQSGYCQQKGRRTLEQERRRTESF